MELVVLNGPKIHSGESVSDACDCSGGVIVRITMPTEWTPANLTFQISSDGVGFNDLFCVSGEEVLLPVTAGVAILVPPELTKAIKFIKFRSGSRESPVIQPDLRVFSIALEASA